MNDNKISPTRLIIARHGATFEAGEVPRRVGLRTDMSLSSVGREQADNLGAYLLNKSLVPDVVFSSQLKRTVETAQRALVEMDNLKRPIHQHDWFNEIDYGVDENMPEDVVKARLGDAALHAWETNNIPPPGWFVTPVDMIEKWRLFANDLTKNYAGKTTLVVTSNGVARFAPELAVNGRDFVSTVDTGRKMGVGQFSLFQFSPSLNGWILGAWNVKPTTNFSAKDQVSI